MLCFGKLTGAHINKNTLKNIFHFEGVYLKTVLLNRMGPWGWGCWRVEACVSAFEYRIIKSKNQHLVNDIIAVLISHARVSSLDTPKLV